MKKYLIAFRIALSNLFTYRANFLIDRIQDVITILLLYFLWLALSGKTGRFAGFTTHELTTYVLGVNIVRAWLYGIDEGRIAADIRNGSFSNYLIKPVNHFLFFYVQELAHKLLAVGFVIIETAVLAMALNAKVVVASWQTVVLVLALAVLGQLLYFILSYCLNLIAFWSNEISGPRFMFQWLRELLSGSYIPLSVIFQSLAYAVVQLLPFMYLIYFPMLVYLGKFTHQQIWHGVAIHGIWIIVAGSFAYVVWNKGLKKYTGQGI